MTRDLAEFMDRWAGSRQAAVSRHADIPNDLLHATFWQSWIHCRFSNRDMVRRSQLLVVSHSSNRRDLLILDPEYESDVPETIATDRYLSAIGVVMQGWERFLDDRAVPQPEQGTALEAIYERGFHYAREVLEHGGQIAVRARPPQHEMLGRRGIAIVQDGRRGLAGVLAVTADGATGVTGSHHVVDASMRKTIVDQAIEVDGKTARVVSDDIISDSFVATVDMEATRLPIAAPLRGMLPRLYESHHFLGTRGKVATRLLAHTYELPWWQPGTQSRVFTEPHTVPGDSGVALLDAENRVVGFAHGLSGFGAAAPHASWVWAESVFAAHQLQMPTGDRPR